ncbi:MAG: ABC transporter ATP-binding protein [bacterium]|nr:MAG: ABC transporter ATP-binding protein [bacterium]
MIRLEDIGFAYPNSTRVLEGLDLLCDEGTRIGIVGANGSGKTTLLHIIMGLLRPTSGTVTLFGRQPSSEADFREARRRMGFVFQDADDQLFCPTVAEDVAFGPRNLGRSAKQAHEMVSRTLDMLGIEHLEKRVTYQLSGGEKRLVALATALAMEPEVLILDEPTAGLSEETSEQLLGILSRHISTSIIVSHDRSFLQRASDEVLLLEKGVLTETGMSEMGTWSRSRPPSPGDPL